ncbi:TetR/AcrR family transcriptional regulator [Nocardia salmonicida]|uniref:TetR/AcrR family transcriptional regulator n=1 Tax=Nocardia salmonicida TaxID=53431 RepID=UPI0037B56EF3
MRTNPGRKRRSSAEVQQLIADAAAAEFVENGFERTTVRSVAHRAGVTESMVFRHFDSKAQLFRSTAAAPLVQFMNDFAGSLATDRGQDPLEVTRRFVGGLYDLCMANRHILVSLAAGASDHGATAESSPLAPALHAVIDGVHRYMDSNGSEAFGDIRAAVRLTVALVLGTALAGDALLLPDEPGSEIPAALAQFVLFGAGYTPQARWAVSGDLSRRPAQA